MFICFVNFLHLLWFYTWVTPTYTKDCDKATAKKTFLSNSWQVGKLVTYFIWKNFERVFIFFDIFIRKKSLFLKFIFIKLSYMSKQFSKTFYFYFHKNITCVKGILLKGTAFLSVITCLGFNKLLCYDRFLPP